MKTPINIQRIHKDDIITFYCAEETKWIQAQITLLGLNFVKLTALEGNLEGFKWSASMTEIQDPDFYRPYIPEPPKRKKKLFGFIKRIAERKRYKKAAIDVALLDSSEGYEEYIESFKNKTK